MFNEMLTLSNLNISFDNQLNPVVQNVELSLQQGCCVGLVGESGSGKTLSALSILQLLPSHARVSQSSAIMYRNKNLLDLSERQMRSIRGKHIGMIFQDAMSA